MYMGLLGYVRGSGLAGWKTTVVTSGGRRGDREVFRKTVIIQWMLVSSFQYFFVCLKYFVHNLKIHESTLGLNGPRYNPFLAYFAAFAC